MNRHNMRLKIQNPFSTYSLSLTKLLIDGRDPATILKNSGVAKSYKICHISGSISARRGKNV